MLLVSMVPTMAQEKKSEEKALMQQYYDLLFQKKDTVKMLGSRYEPLRDAFRISVPDTSAATDLIIKYPQVFKDYEITKGKMDDVFLAVTGKFLTGGEK